MHLDATEEAIDSLYVQLLKVNMEIKTLQNRIAYLNGEIINNRNSLREELGRELEKLKYPQSLTSELVNLRGEIHCDDHVVRQVAQLLDIRDTDVVRAVAIAKVYHDREALKRKVESKIKDLGLVGNRKSEKFQQLQELAKEFGFVLQPQLDFEKMNEENNNPFIGL